MKIALFTESFLPGVGGTENVVLRLAYEYSKEHEVVVFAPSYHRAYEENLSLPFKVVRARSIGIKNDFRGFPSLTGKLKRAIEEFKPDVLHTHTLGAMASYANKYGKKHNIPVVCTIHTKFWYCYKNVFKLDFIASAILKFVINRANNADRVTSVSNSMIAEFKPFGLKKELTIIRNGNDLREVNIEEKTKNKRFTLLYAGMLVEYKNLTFSLKALAELKKRRFDFVFYMIGAGMHEKKYKKLVKKLGLENNVIFTGVIEKQKMSEYYKKADLVFFTSVADSEGLILIEGAENGTPSLVLEGTGASERFTDNETGFISKNDVNVVANRIEELMNNEELLRRVGRRAHEVCIPWENVAKQYLALYEEEIEKKK